MEKTIGFIITAGHLDIEWYQPLCSYRFWTVEALEQLKKAAERTDFKSYVLDGQIFPLEEYLEVVPEDEECMKELIRQGKLAVGPFYTQFDEWIPSAENMIRNCLYGKRKSHKYGGYMKAGYLPDNFGHPLQMPQILQNFGIDSLMFMRGMPEVSGDHPDEFIYEGLDGSTVLASHFRESYSGAFDIFDKDNDPIQPREVPYYDEYLSFEYHKELAWHDDPERIARNMIKNVHRIKSRYPSNVVALIAGYDHLPPQINIGETVKKANEMQDEIEFVMGNAEEYVRMVQKNMKDPVVYKDMELLGSRYQSILLGALSTRTYLKRHNFGCEALLERYAEPLDAIASVEGYRDRHTLLDEAWRYMLINSAHDSIHGSSTDEVHVEMEARFAKVRQIAAGVIHEAMAYLGAYTARWWEKAAGTKSIQWAVKATFAENNGYMHKILPKGFLTYTPVTTENAQPSEIWLPIGDAEVCICDEAGNTYPTQIEKREPIEKNGLGQPRNSAFPDAIYRKILFMHNGEMGSVRSYAAIPGKQADFENLQAGKDFLENKYVRVDVTNAGIDLWDKKNDKHYYNLNLLEEEADAGDAWDFSKPWIDGEIVHSSMFTFESRLVDCGQVKATLEINGNMKVPACLEGDIRSGQKVDIPVKFYISIWRDTERVDVKLELDNNAKDHRIRLKIPANVKTNHVLSQGHLAVLDRPVKRPEGNAWYQTPTRLLPCREWIAVQDAENGLAVALKGMYDYEAVMNPATGEPDLYVTLVRGIGMMGRINMMERKVPASEAIQTPEAQCLGKQVMEWSYVPYQVSETDKAPFVSKVQSYLYPAVNHAVRSELVSEKYDSELPAFYRWEEKNIQFSALKKCADKDGYILRFYENQGRKTKMKLYIYGFSKAWYSNMAEEKLEPLEIVDDCVEIEVLPYKAVSIMLKREE